MSREGSHSFYKAAKGGLVDGHGVATIRYKSKLHHIGMGRALKGTRIILLVAGRHIRIITTEGRLLEAEFDASPERVWQLWADPRQLERWWGPPTYPASVDAHDLRPGGRVEYHTTGPEGDQPRGFWDVDDVQAPHRIVSAMASPTRMARRIPSSR